ncbi:hypothetical protein CWS43_10065 [Rahnella sp. AA]|uniref:hypothetical protein n=1 Tax=Rahnella sp. AA TaxID=2057180 RepID=UPI000C339034|nr:hypothetical protein [Rahnella sp. AA]PKE31013.1 hypothetical protein CWS43_10065 [Rahnella sp. AA]
MTETTKLKRRPSITDHLTDEYIACCFGNTNFGRTDYRNLLAHSVLKKACDSHCGHTITCIMKQMGLITRVAEVPTKLGKQFLIDCYYRAEICV